MIPIDEKIKEICKRRKFTSFWEAFDYMKLAGYEELDAIMIAMQLFKGKIWDRVVFATKTYDEMVINGCASGTTCGLRIIDDDDEPYGECEEPRLTILGDVDDIEEETIPDVMNVKLFVMTEEADEVYMSFYSAYAETRDYEPNETLEKHIKAITTSLTTELGIKLFNSWKK